MNGRVSRIAGAAAWVLLLLAAPSFAATTVIFSTRTLLPGETLRVEIDGVSPSAQCKIRFLKKTFTFFAVGPNAQRALIGVPLDTEPGRYTLTLLGVDPALRDQALEIATKTFTTENVNFTQEKTALMLSERRESKIIGAAKLFQSRDQQWESVFMYPVDGPVIGEYGIKRLRNGTIVAGFHKGIDLRAAKGTPLLASNAGTVMMASRFKAHGNTVMINHGQGVMTIYLHMDTIAVKVRQKVRKGQEIGTVGATGLATAPHVHFQVFVHGVPVDPKPWMETEF